MHPPARVPLANLPTPIRRLDRLSRQRGGPEIYLKHDDETGLATGGNKLRKLEFLLGEAQAQGTDHLITLGGPQSNHARQTAAAAAKLGLRCSVCLRGHPPAAKLGNLLLDDLLGAEIHFAGSRTREEVARELFEKLRAEGRKPYLIPVGGSTGLGAVGYVHALREALDQLANLNVDIDTMVVASSSGGTQAGLVLGQLIYGYPGSILGISIDETVATLTGIVRNIALDCAKVLKFSTSPELLRVHVNADYLGGGYAVVGELEREAIRTVARAEGILLDPVYTGRAMGGLFDLIRKGTFKRGQRVLFWHTGGAAALSAFADQL